MQQNATEFTWTKPKVLGAQLVADDELSDSAIAAQLGINKVTLERWKAQPAFAERVALLIREAGEALQRYSIARKDKRMDRLNDRWQRGHRVIEARADEYAHIPGGDTGLLVKTQKLSATGEVVTEYQVDTGLLSELRAHEKQAAQELGQWDEGKGQGTSLSVPVQVNVGISIDGETQQRRERVLGLLLGGPGGVEHAPLPRPTPE